MLTLLLLVPALSVASGQDCPRYPQPQREMDRMYLERDRVFAQFGKARHGMDAAAVRGAERRNLIDDFIFGKMDADGVPPAPPSSDDEFLRRVHIDLTGRTPTVAQAEAFLQSSDGDKRERLIEQLLSSPEYVDRWTLFYGNLLEITSAYYNYISVQGRNRFHQFLRDFVRNDRSYADVARELITAEGDAHLSGPPNYIVRGFQQGDLIQDTWDVLTDRTTVRFLGMKTECVSCHDGRRHLEEINLFLLQKRRFEFWQMSAFFSRTTIQQTPIDSFVRQVRNVVGDKMTGAYFTTAGGPRPPRSGGPWEPVFMLTGEQPQSELWRRELARMVANHRQFARAAVNYLWAALFVHGIVDPPDGWDLQRIDPKNPPPSPWTIQPSHPELMEALADEFIRSGYSAKKMIRLMVNSGAYQLSSAHPGPWRPEYDRYFARHISRRMSAEEAYDAIARATATETPMNLEGFDTPVMFASQLPDPTEPRGDFTVSQFLSLFGRGDWWRNPTVSKTTVLQALYMMNDNGLNFRTFAGRDGGRTTRVGQIMASMMDDDTAVRQLYLAALSRYPASEEMAAVARNKRGPREQWLSDLQWALLNKTDFLIQH
ncbi:MAG: DUF1553 domain-containing protein [Acidobacteria bacterium]|nr:DUF1553 domain-containing protein [Acidobacteriota bacterium]